MDTTQILLTIVILVLTAMLTVIGSQVYFIIREARTAVKKLNKILDNFQSLSENIAQPVFKFSALVAGLKSGLSLWEIIQERKKKKEK